MATKITVALEDDLDGGPASETVRFGLGGAQYEIDLNKKNARAFRKKLTPFVEHARQAGPTQRHGPARTASSRQRSADIRAWAKATGLAVSDRGRIPASVVDQYEATRRPLRTPGHHRHEPIRSDGLWPRPASQRRAGGPFRLPAYSRMGRASGRAVSGGRGQDIRPHRRRHPGLAATPTPLTPSGPPAPRPPHHRRKQPAGPLRGCGGHLILRVADELKMPGGIRPAHHQQRMATIRSVISPEQHLESDAPDTEPLRCRRS